MALQEGNSLFSHCGRFISGKNLGVYLTVSSERPTAGLEAVQKRNRCTSARTSQFSRL